MSEAKWYVVHTYSGYENKVKVDIEKTIENRHLEDQILEVRVPLQEVAELKNGALKQVQKKMFPGYVLLNMVMNDDTWYVVRNTRGVTGFVGPGSKPVPLTDEEMLPLGNRRKRKFRSISQRVIQLLSQAVHGKIPLVLSLPLMCRNRQQRSMLNFSAAKRR